MGRSRLGRPRRSRIDAAVTGVEEDRLVPVSGGGREGHARARLEHRRIELRAARAGGEGRVGRGLNGAGRGRFGGRTGLGDSHRGGDGPGDHHDRQDHDHGRPLLARPGTRGVRWVAVWGKTAVVRVAGPIGRRLLLHRCRAATDLCHARCRISERPARAEPRHEPAGGPSTAGEGRSIEGASEPYRRTPRLPRQQVGVWSANSQEDDRGPRDRCVTPGPGAQCGYPKRSSAVRT